ncbi:MAG: TonB-dependent receptor [Bacteroidota bacterium]
MLKRFLLLVYIFLCYQGAFAQKVEILIEDEDEEPLIGVNVYANGDMVHTITDFEGKFILENEPAYDFEVFISYIGYETKRINYQELLRLKKIQLQAATESLSEILIVGRKNEPAADLPYQIERIAQEAIASTQSPTSADALRDHAGVFVQKSQGGGGSPVLRGFEANKVLLVVDGVRMNNAIYRNGHLQNAITVDAAVLEQMEVIYGPGSLTYGSDALGGVIHFRTKMPQLAFEGSEKVTSNFYTRYATANQEKSAHLDFNFGKRKWATLTSITYADFGDLKAGNNYVHFPANFGKRAFYVETSVLDERVEDEIIVNGNPDVQVGTAYSQLDILQKVRFQANDYLNLLANFQYSTSSNIPRYDRLTALDSENPQDFRFTEWYYGPQDRFLASLQTQISRPSTVYDKALVIAAYQKIGEERFDRRFGRNSRSFQLEDVQVFSVTADFDKFLHANERHQLSYGLDWNFNDVQSEAGLKNLQNGAIERSEPTRYPSGGSQMNTLAAYSSYRWKSRDSILNFHAGLRYTYTNTFSLFGANDPIQWSPSYYTEGVRNEDGDLTWGLGLTAITPNGWQLRFSTASSFRAPNLDDFSKIRVKDGFVTIPNPNLDSERTINGEITLGKLHTTANSKIQVNATAFYTYLQNAIVRSNFALPDGSFQLNLEDESLRTVANVNAENAYIYGASANVKIDFLQAWQFFSTFNWTYGRRLFPLEEGFNTEKLALPLAHIPPLYGRTSLRYEKGDWRVEGVLRYNGAKKVEDFAVLDVQRDIQTQRLIYLREGSADNLEQTPRCEDGNYCIGTPAWMTYNLYIQYTFGKLSAQIGLENITDVHYRPFASGLSSAGRNLILGIRGAF